METTEATEATTTFGGATPVGGASASHSTRDRRNTTFRMSNEAEGLVLELTTSNDPGIVKRLIVCVHALGVHIVKLKVRASELGSQCTMRLSGAEERRLPPEQTLAIQALVVSSVGESLARA